MCFASADIQDCFANVIGNPPSGEHTQKSCFGGVPEAYQVEIPARGVIRCLQISAWNGAGGWRAAFGKKVVQNSCESTAQSCTRSSIESFVSITTSHSCADRDNSLP